MSWLPEQSSSNDLKEQNYRSSSSSDGLYYFKLRFHRSWCVTSRSKTWWHGRFSFYCSLACSGHNMQLTRRMLGSFTRTNWLGGKSTNSQNEWTGKMLLYSITSTTRYVGNATTWYDYKLSVILYCEVLVLLSSRLTQYLVLSLLYSSRVEVLNYRSWLLSLYY